MNRKIERERQQQDFERNVLRRRNAIQTTLETTFEITIWINREDQFTQMDDGWWVFQSYNESNATFEVSKTISNLKKSKGCSLKICDPRKQWNEMQDTWESSMIERLRNMVSNNMESELWFNEMFHYQLWEQDKGRQFLEEANVVGGIVRASTIRYDTYEIPKCGTRKTWQSSKLRNECIL